MANRFFDQFGLSLEKQVVKLYAYVTFGASGAPTLTTSSSKGISSIAKDSTGQYTITLQDTYYKLLGVHATWIKTTAPVGPIVYVKTNAVTTPVSGGTLTIITGDYVNGAAAEPASGEILILEITVGNSSAF